MDNGNEPEKLTRTYIRKMDPAKDDHKSSGWRAAVDADNNDLSGLHAVVNPTVMMPLISDESGERYRIESLVVLDDENFSVYLAFDRFLNRPVHLLTLLPELNTGKAAQERVLNLARLMSTIGHEAVPEVYDVISGSDGAQILVREALDGDLLSRCCLDSESGNSTVLRRLTIDTLIDCARQVADILSHAHSCGIILTNLRPESLHLCHDGKIHLIDWNNAVSISQWSRDAVAGTPMYMSPEQARNEPLDGRSDVFSLCLIIYQLLTNRMPILSSDSDEFWRRKERGEWDRDQHSESEWPYPLGKILEHGLNPDKNQRLSAKQLKQQLDKLSNKSFHHTTMRAIMVGSALVATVLLLILALFISARSSSPWLPTHYFDFANNNTSELSDLVTISNYIPEIGWENQLFGRSPVWRIQDNSLIGSADKGFHNIGFSVPAPGDARISWSVTPKDNPYNLNAVLGHLRRDDGYVVHIAGFGDPSYVALSYGPNFNITADARLTNPIRVGNTYQIEVLLLGNIIEVHIDGQKLISYSAPRPPRLGGQLNFALEVSSNTIAINNLAIDTSRTYNTRPSELALAHAFADANVNQRAIAFYDESLRLNLPKHFIVEALVGKCFSHAGAGDYHNALRSLDHLSLMELNRNELALSLRMRRHILHKLGRYDESRLVQRRLLEEFSDHNILESVLFDMTEEALAEINTHIEYDPFNDSLNDSRRAIENKSRAHMASIAAWAQQADIQMINNSFFRKIVNFTRYYGRQHVLLPTVLEDENSAYIWHVNNGDFASAMTFAENTPNRMATLLINLRMFDEALTIENVSMSIYARAALLKGDLERANHYLNKLSLTERQTQFFDHGLFDTLLEAEIPTIPVQSAWLESGDYDKFINLKESPFKAWSRILQGEPPGDLIDANADLIWATVIFHQQNGDPAYANDLGKRLFHAPPMDFLTNSWIGYFIPILMAFDAGDSDNAHKMLKAILHEQPNSHGRMPGLIASYLLGESSMQQIIESHPTIYQDSIVLLAQAIRHDIDNNSTLAREYYTKFLAIEPIKRTWSPLQKYFVAWRNKQL